MFQASKQSSPYRKRKRYSVTGSLDNSASDPETTPLDLIFAENCYFDRRIGKPVRRGGSTTNSPTTGLGVPLGIGWWMTPASALIPFTRTILANFAGSAFHKYSGSWSSVTLDANTSFGSQRATQFAQLGTNLYIAGGRLAKWAGGANNIFRCGIPAHGSAPSVAVNAGAGTFSAVTGYSYMFCFYNSTLGLESDWSPVSSSTGTFTNKLRVEVTTPTAAPAAAGVDKKRIYRTLDGGATYYLLSTENLATATYNDTTADSALTTAASASGFKALPPDSTYVLATYANRLWCIDSTNPFIIKFSDAYTGSDINLEYWPTDNYVVSSQPVTGLYVTPGRMLVFHPRGVSQITGGSIEDFLFSPLHQGAGTVFPSSITSDGATVAFLSERGFVRMDGAEVNLISREIDDDIRSYLSLDYNANLYVSGAFDATIRQFVWSLSAQSTAGAPWEVAGSGALAEWEDATTHATDVWEDPGSPSSDNVNRNLMFGWSKDLSGNGKNRWHKFTFAAFSDLNSSGAYASCLAYPVMGEGSIDPQQDYLYIGYHDGTDGEILTAFRSDKAIDDSTNFTAKLLTGRINPTGDMNYKRFFSLDFPGAYSDPSSDGNGTIKYLLDRDDPVIQSFSTELITLSDTTDCKTLPRGKARFLHLYVEDTSTSQTKPLLSEFSVSYRSSNQREGR